MFQIAPLDYPFLTTYSVLHAIACTAATDTTRRQRRKPVAALGPTIAWARLAAGGFDAIENAALLGVLDPALVAQLLPCARGDNPSKGAA